MDAQEQEDIEKLKKEMQSVKNNCFEYLKMLDDANEKELHNMGYTGKSNEEAMRLAFKSYRKIIKMLVDHHVKKYPD